MDILKKIIKCAGIVLGLNIIFIIFLTLTYMIPVDGKIKEHVGNSLYALDGDDKFPVFHDPNGFWNDNSTDMEWINMAVTTKSNPLKGAVGLYWKTTTDEILEGGEARYYDLINALYYPDADNTGVMEYSRCGILTVGFLKILFLLYEITDIRYISYFIICSLVLLLFYRLFDIKQKSLIVPLAVAIGMRVWLMQSTCLTTMCDILTAIVAMLAVISMTKKGTFSKGHIYLFLITGIFAFEMGMFEAPLLTLGMPLVLSVVLNNEKDNKIQSWIRVLEDSIVWVCGYLASMLFKQFLAQIVLGNHGRTGTGVMMMWLAPELGIRARIDRIIYCLDGLFSPIKVKLPIIIIIVLVLIYYIIKYGSQKTGNNLLLAFVSLYPIVWIFIFTRHAQHYWVANILSITVFALLSILNLHVKGKETNKN